MGEIIIEVKRKAEENSKAPVMMISATEGFINQSERYSSNNAGKSLKKYTLLKKGELAYNHGYSKTRNFGSCFTLEIEQARIPFVYHSFSLKGENDSVFWGKYLNSGLFDGKLRRLVASTARMDGLLNISFENYSSMPVNIPSLPEQKKIAAFFTLLDRRIQKQRQLVECLKTYKRGVIDKFFCNNSYDFELYRLEEIGKFIRGLSYKEDEQTYDNQKTLVLRSNNIRDNGFLNYKEGLQFVTKIPDCEQLLQKNDLVFCMANGSSKLVGKNAVYDGRYNGKITVGTFCCIYRSKFHILQYYFQSSLFQKTLGKIQQGGGGSIGNLKPSDLEPLIVKLPNKYTQEKIFNCLSFFDSYIKLHENKLSSLLSLKSSLLQKMFI